MSDENRKQININFTGPWLLILILLCVGDPDLIDAMVHWLMAK